MRLIEKKIEEEVETKVDRKWEEHLKKKRLELILSHSICLGGGFALGLITNHYIEKYINDRPPRQ